MKASVPAGSADGEEPNKVSTWFSVMSPLCPKTRAWVPAGRLASVAGDQGGPSTCRETEAAAAVRFVAVVVTFAAVAVRFASATPVARPLVLS